MTKYNDRITNKLTLFHSPVLITPFFSFTTLIFIISIAVTTTSIIVILSSLLLSLNHYY